MQAQRTAADSVTHKCVIHRPSEAILSFHNEFQSLFGQKRIQVGCSEKLITFYLKKKSSFIDLAIFELGHIVNTGSNLSEMSFLTLVQIMIGLWEHRQLRGGINKHSLELSQNSRNILEKCS